MFPTWAWPRSVVDIDDIPSTYEHSVWNASRGVRDRVLTGVRLVSWIRRDRLLAERFSVLAVCSDADKDYLRRIGVRAPLHVIPNGYARPAAMPVWKPAAPPRIGFIGIFDYPPNREGVEWFVRHCWPLVKREVPEAHLRLVGRYSDGELAPRGPDIEGLGWVADSSSEILTWSAMVVPVQIGAGTRGKIAQAFSLKCPVVSTPLGAHGYDVEDQRELFLARSPGAFAAACVQVIRQPQVARTVAERAWQRFLTHWTWDAIRPRVWAAAEDCLRSARSEQPSSCPENQRNFASSR